MPSMRPAARSRSCCSVVLYSRIVDHVLEVLLEEGRVRGRALHADGLALQHRLPRVDRLLRRVRVLLEVQDLPGAFELRERRILHRAPAVRAGGVDARELDHLLALRRDVHAGHDGVVLAGLERRDDAVPILGDDLALDVHAAAELVRELDLEAVELALRRREVPRRVGALGRDLDRLPLLALRRGAARERRAERGQVPMA